MGRAAAIALLALALIPAAEARTLAAFATSDKQPLELRNGDGYMYMTARGAMLGRFDRGRLVVTDWPVGADTTISVSGADRSYDVTERTTVYTGRFVTFRIFGGSWTVRIKAVDIDASAVVRGTVGLRRDGDRGAYSIGGAPYQRWPADYTLIRLGGD